MGSSTYSGQWSCVPNSQYKASKSHSSSIPTWSGSHRAMNLVRCDLSAATPESASWFCHSLEQSANKLVHLVVTHLGLDHWSAWPNSAKAPLRERWRCPRTPSWPCPYVIVVWSGPVWRSWLGSSSFPEDVSSRKKIPSFVNELTTLFCSNQRDGGRRCYLQYPIQLISQSKNNNARPWIIHSMSLPQVWLT